MSFVGCKAFFERPYYIDFERRKVYIYPIKNLHHFLIDFITEFIYKFIFLIPIIIILLMISLIFMSEKLFLIACLFCIIYFISILIFNTLYMLLDNKIFTNIQMIFEYPVYALFYKKAKKELVVRNTKRVVYKFDYYYKYKMLLYGDCKKYIKKIRYKVRSPFEGNRFLILDFIKPVDGKITLDFRGKLLSTEINYRNGKKKIIKEKKK